MPNRAFQILRDHGLLRSPPGAVLHSLRLRRAISTVTGVQDVICITPARSTVNPNVSARIRVNPDVLVRLLAEPDDARTQLASQLPSGERTTLRVAGRRDPFPTMRGQKWYAFGSDLTH